MESLLQKDLWNHRPYTSVAHAYVFFWPKPRRAVIVYVRVISCMLGWVVWLVAALRVSSLLLSSTRGLPGMVAEVLWLKVRILYERPPHTNCNGAYG